MTQKTKKIEGTFYPLTPEMGQRLRSANLTAAEWKLWSYLIEIDPFGDRYFELPDTLSIMQVCNLKKTTLYKAMAKFQSLELFDFQDKGFFVRNLGFPQKRKTVRENGNDSAKTESCPQKRKTVRENGDDSANSENQPPEPPSNKDSVPSQTIQTVKINQTNQTGGGGEKNLDPDLELDNENKTVFSEQVSQSDLGGFPQKELAVQNNGSQDKDKTKKLVNSQGSGDEKTSRAVVCETTNYVTVSPKKKSVKQLPKT